GIAIPGDQALANRVPLDLGAVAEVTLDAKLAMAELVLHGVDLANRRRHGLPGRTTETTGDAGSRPAGPPRRPSPPLPHTAGTDRPGAGPDPPRAPRAVEPHLSASARTTCRPRPDSASRSASFVTGAAVLGSATAHSTHGPGCSRPSRTRPRAWVPPESGAAWRNALVTSSETT